MRQQGEADKRFLDLILAASDPQGSTSLSADDLAISLGINDLPTPDEALALVEKEVLGPVKDLSGKELYKWQMYVFSPALPCSVIAIVPQLAGSVPGPRKVSSAICKNLGVGTSCRRRDGATVG
jgi:antiviral helicase SKI2